jgi:hypothetical protein
MTNAGAVFVNMFTNPFQTGQGMNYICRTPDGGSEPRGLMMLHGRYSLAAGTATSGYAQLVGLTGQSNTADQSFHITYGADADDISGAVAMTTRIECFDTCGNPLQSVHAARSRFRILGAGLRVTGSGIDTEGGRLTGGSAGLANLRSADAAYQANYMWGNKWDNVSYSIKQGITVRRNPPSYGGSDDEFHYLSASTFSTPMTNTNMPMVKFTGLTASTILTFEWQYYVEFLTSDELPFPLETAEFEPELAHIYHLINTMPYTSEAHTFPSFLAGMWKAIKTAGRYVWDRGLSRTAGRISDKFVHKIDQVVDTVL